jgi:uncharacterized damage-inducible protein DinB
MKKPLENEFPKDKYFSFYIEQIDFQNVIEALMVQKEVVINLYKNLPEDQKMYQYAPDKWTPQQILGHITDTERIFGYRALCIARGEKQALLGFDENEYMDASHFNEQSFESLLEQYRLVRESSIALFSSFSEEVASRMGNANGHAVSARALVWMIAGHERHHLNVLKERYNIA